MKNIGPGAAGFVRPLSIACVALISFACGSEQQVRPEQAVVGAKLTLQGFRSIPASDVFRADLSESTGGLSSGYLTRNVLFIEASGEGRWLLSDNEHIVYEESIRAAVADGAQPPPAVAVAVLATLQVADTRLGQLYLRDLPGRRIQKVADKVKVLHSTSFTPAGIALLYEGPEGYVLGHYSAETFTKLLEVNIKVPALK